MSHALCCNSSLSAPRRSNHVIEFVPPQFRIPLRRRPLPSRLHPHCFHVINSFASVTLQRCFLRLLSAFKQLSAPSAPPPNLPSLLHPSIASQTHWSFAQHGTSPSTHRHPPVPRNSQSLTTEQPPLTLHPSNRISPSSSQRSPKSSAARVPEVVSHRSASSFSTMPTAPSFAT